MESPTLLGYLSRFGSFSMQSEVLCTQGLAYLLQEHKDPRLTLAAEIKSRTGIELVATNDVLYHVPARRPLQDVLTCIREKTTIGAAGLRTRGAI